MFIASLLITGDFIHPARGADRGGQTKQPTLIQYIESLHWNPAKSGPLIALDAAKTTQQDAGLPGLAAFQRKLVKVGGLNVIALNWSIALDESDLPNPYQALSNEDKFIFLLATMNQSDLAKLTGQGICARDLTGQQRLALLSMIPNPLKIIKGEASGSGFSTQGDQDPAKFPAEQIDLLRLQLRKGVSVMYKAYSDGNGTKGAESLQSFDYAGPSGTPVFRSTRVFAGPDAMAFPGRIVESMEKKSDLAWTDPRLAKTLELKSTSRVSEVVDTLRASTGIEIYADPVVAGLVLNACGATVSANDLLRGLALAFGGVVRKVGPAYILTANLEGACSREVRLHVRRSLGQISIRSEILQWKADLAKKGLFEKLAFAKDDPFHSSEIAAKDFAPESSEFESKWVPVSHLPTIIKTAIDQAAADGIETDTSNKPIPELRDHVKVSTTFGFRLVLPDGTPLESQAFDSNSIQTSWAPFPPPNPELPLNPKSLLLGSAIGIRSDDPQVVTKLCAEVKEYKIPEIWLDSIAPSAIKSAIDSGLVVDLVIHPWKVLPDEICPDPDRNVIGQTGAQLNQFPGSKIEPFSRWTYSYVKSFSAGDTNLATHWDRLANLAPKQGIHGVIVLDVAPGGYRSTIGDEDSDVFASTQEEGGLLGMVPTIAQFGYSTALRLQFVRKRHTDPIDLIGQLAERLSPPCPYFEISRILNRQLGPYPDVDFPQIDGETDDSMTRDWRSLRGSVAAAKIKDFIGRLSAVSNLIFVQETGEIAKEHEMTGVRGVSLVNRALNGLPSKSSSVRFFNMNPLNTEDEQGHLMWKPYVPLEEPVCIDLGEVPPDRFSMYLRYIFKSVSGTAKSAK